MYVHVLILNELFNNLKYKYSNIKIDYQNDISVGGKRNLTSEQWNKRSPCSGGRVKMIIQPNGDVTLCNHCPHSNMFVVGNICNQSLLEIWHSKKLYDFLYPNENNFKGTVCFECNEFDKCHFERGYCYKDSFYSYRTIYDAPPECPKQDKIPPRMI